MAFAGTITKKKEGTAGDLRYVVADVTLDSSYDAGGELITAAMLGRPGGTIQILMATTGGGYLPEYDYTNSKLIVRRGDNPNAAAAPAIEVTAAVNLSAIVVRVLAFISGV